MLKYSDLTHSEVATESLLSLDSLEESLEVASTEALMVPSLDDLQEEGGAILYGLGENLEQVTLRVVVNQNLELSESLDVLLDLEANVLEAVSQSVVVSVGNLLEELDTAGLHTLDSGDNVLSAHGDVLDTGATVEVNVLLNLGLAHAVGRFVDGHLDVLVEVGHYY